MNLSYVEKRNNVVFPSFNNERVYMLPFYKKNGLPSNLKHWQKTIDMMLENVETEDVIYLMIDQSYVKANSYHRRPGVHIDGYWNPELNGHGGHRIRMSGHNHESGSHSTSINTPPSGSHITHNGGHILTPNNNDIGGHTTKPSSVHITTPKKRMGGVSLNDWEPEGLILASSLTAARAWNGLYNDMPKEGGDCSHIDLSGLQEIEMKAGYTYCGNVTMLHESTLIKEDSYRTVVRLNVPNWTPDYYN